MTDNDTHFKRSSRLQLLAFGTFRDNRGMCVRYVGVCRHIVVDVK